MSDQDRIVWLIVRRINKFDVGVKGLKVNSYFIWLTLSLPQVTKTEFLLTISIQYQAGR